MDSQGDSQCTEVNPLDCVDVTIEEDEDCADLSDASGVSGLWKYFEKNQVSSTSGASSKDRPQAKCTVKDKNGVPCNALCKRTDGNTSSMKSHLRTKHPFAFAELTRKGVSFDRSATTTSSAQRSTSISGAGMKQPRLDLRVLDAKTTEMCANSVAYCIASLALPYRIVDTEAFRKMLDTLRPGMGKACPGRKAMAEKYIPRLYNETVSVIQGLLGSADYISLTTDAWTSEAKDPYVGLTEHFISSEWVLTSTTLGCILFNESHSSKNLADFFETTLHDWKLSKSAIAAITTDNGANVVAAVRELGITVIKCFAHSLQLGIQKVYEHPQVAPVLKKVQQIHSTLNASTSLQRDMKETAAAMSKECVSLPTSCKTRWWTVLRLLKACDRIKSVLRVVLAKDRRVAGRRRNVNYANLILTPKEEEVLCLLISLLSPLQEITEDMSGESYVTASGILPLVPIIGSVLAEASPEPSQIYSEEDMPEEFLGNGVAGELSGLIQASIQERYVAFTGGVAAQDGARSKAHLEMASFVDPRFKAEHLDDTDKQNVQDQAIDECSSFSDSCATAETNGDDSAPVPAKKMRGFAAIFAKAKGQTAGVVKTPRDLAQQQVESYLKLPLLEMDQDPLKWWKFHETGLPLLSKLAKKYLSTQGTSVPSERIFSCGGRTVTDFRHCLTGEHVSQLIFLSMNRHFVSLKKA